MCSKLIQVREKLLKNQIKNSWHSVILVKIGEVAKASDLNVQHRKVNLILI